MFSSPSISTDTPKKAVQAAASFAKIESVLSGAVDRFAELQEKFQIEAAEIRKKHSEVVEEIRRDFELEKIRLYESIDTQRQEIEKRSAELDDRTNTFVR